MDEPIRLGYHGSPVLPRRIAGTAGATLHQYDIADPFRAIRTGELDVMIVKFRLDEPDLRVSGVVARDDRAAVVSTGHPLAARTSVSIEDLADVDAFAAPGSMPAYIWDQVVPLRTPRGQPIRRRYRVTTVPAMMDLVRHAGAVHISLASLADLAPPGVRVVPIHDLPPAAVALA